MTSASLLHLTPASASVTTSSEPLRRASTPTPSAPPPSYFTAISSGTGTGTGTSAVSPLPTSSSAARLPPPPPSPPPSPKTVSSSVSAAGHSSNPSFPQSAAVARVSSLESSSSSLWPLSSSSTIEPAVTSISTSTSTSTSKTDGQILPPRHRLSSSTTTTPPQHPRAAVLLGVSPRWFTLLQLCRALACLPAAWWGGRCVLSLLGEQQLLRLLLRELENLGLHLDLDLDVNLGGSSSSNLQQQKGGRTAAATAAAKAALTKILVQVGAGGGSSAAAAAGILRAGRGAGGRSGAAVLHDVAAAAATGHGQHHHHQDALLLLWIEAERRFRLTEMFLAIIWCGAGAYLSFLFADCLMTRWLLHYTPFATVLRLLTLNAIIAYVSSLSMWLSGASEDPRMLLPAWVSITTVLTLLYHLTQRKIMVDMRRKEAEAVAAAAAADHDVLSSSAARSPSSSSSSSSGAHVLLFAAASFVSFCVLLFQLY